MEKHFEIRSVICLADVQNMLPSISQNEEARRQLIRAAGVAANQGDALGVEHVAGA